MYLTAVPGLGFISDEAENIGALFMARVTGCRLYDRYHIYDKDTPDGSTYTNHGTRVRSVSYKLYSTFYTTEHFCIRLSIKRSHEIKTRPREIKGDKERTR